MTQQETIRKIADLVLQNAEKTSSTGLYNGKAGLSITLFMAAEYLRDESMEDVAYHLLKESLILKNDEMNFENGWTGIGYAILYLVENKYLEADFDEIFGTKYESIVRYFKNIEMFPARLLDSLPTVYFFSAVRNIKNEDDRVPEIIRKFFEGIELYLMVQFHDFTDIRYINKKVNVINTFNTYLKMVDYSGYKNFSRALLEDFAAIYRKGRIASSLETGYYLSKIVEQEIPHCVRNEAKRNEESFEQQSKPSVGFSQIHPYEDIINENINNGINNIYPNTLSLRERIDLAKIIPNPKVPSVTGQEMYQEKTIPALLKTIDEKSLPFGYGAGLGRLLIYCVNKQAELL